MILLMAGTEDGRYLGGELHTAGAEMLITVTTEYGRSLFERVGLGKMCRCEKLDLRSLVLLIREKQMAAIVDATHPYAERASQTAIAAARETGILYVRYERAETPLPDSPLILRAADHEEAIRLCKEMGRRILLTIGSSRIERFAHIEGKEVFVRILPIPENVRRCIEAGVPPSHVVAMQGPFSKEFNAAMLRELKVDTMVTKDSGEVGGALEKVEAAIENGVKIIVIERPKVEYPVLCQTFGEVKDVLKKHGLLP
jgi:precorrin-6A/cobalt-precorrin-6A reductase